MILVDDDDDDDGEAYGYDTLSDHAEKHGRSTMLRSMVERRCRVACRPYLHAPVAC